jgi:hypothetical protein
MFSHAGKFSVRNILCTHTVFASRHKIINELEVGPTKGLNDKLMISDESVGQTILSTHNAERISLLRSKSFDGTEEIHCKNTLSFTSQRIIRTSAS